MTLAEISDPRKGYVTADDKITLTVEITVQRDERDSYDSRKETGHVGLKNQGATCYMNSLLQYLFHLPYFRKVTAMCSTHVLYEHVTCIAVSTCRQCCLCTAPCYLGMRVTSPG